MVRSFKWKLILAYLLLILIPFTIMGVFSYNLTSEILSDKIYSAGINSMENAKEFVIMHYIDTTEKALTVIKEDIKTKEVLNNSQKVANLLGKWKLRLDLNPNIWQFYIGTENGNFFILPQWLPPADYNHRERPWYQSAVNSDKPIVWSDPYIDMVTGDMVVTAASSIKADGQIQGVLAIDTSLFILSDIVAKIKIGSNGYAILLDNKGNIIGHPDKRVLGKNLSSEPWFSIIGQNNKGAVNLNIDGRNVLVSSVTIPHTGWKLVGFMPQTNLHNEIAPITNRTIVVSVISMLIAIAFSVLYSRNLAGKIDRIVEYMSEVEKGNFSFRCKDISRDEFGIIARKFNLMIATIEDLLKERNITENRLRLQKVYFEHLFENSPESCAILDADDRIVSVNRQFENLFDVSLAEIKGQYLNDVIVPKHLVGEGATLSGKVINGKVVKKETMRKRKDGSLVNVFVLAYPITFNGQLVGIYAIYRDITEIKNAEQKLRYYSLHDALTGAYNRAYFEQEIQRLSQVEAGWVGVILCDVDGLKLVNDAWGHESGDKILIAVVKILQEAIPENCSLSRIGGDEFAILVPSADENLVLEIYHKIKGQLQSYNEANTDSLLSVSVGYSVKSLSETNVAAIVREADNYMYKEKLHRSQSPRSAIVKTLMNALHARDFITEGHADRMQILVEKLAVKAGLAESKISDLRLLAQFHDIGKVGISDKVLFKEGPLTEQEQIEMQKHSEIGYRIAMSSPVLTHIADWILKHHERWDGQGYPLGLKAIEIPVECRILSIVDAYDAMTNDRPYRKARLQSEAVAELKRCQGTQFDPELVTKFIEVISEITD